MIPGRFSRVMAYDLQGGLRFAQSRHNPDAMRPDHSVQFTKQRLERERERAATVPTLNGIEIPLTFIN